MTANKSGVTENPLSYMNFAFQEQPTRVQESESTHALIQTLSLQSHIEGGYFVETDRDPRKVSNPFLDATSEDSTRCASTSIFYMITPLSPIGYFHRNKARTVHTLHKGRARYVILHGVEEGKDVTVETFVVGGNVAQGERLQWIVEGGKYKASFLLPNEDGIIETEGCLISEVSPHVPFASSDNCSKYSMLITYQ
jgi:predicted cupin superfamily sugar epimerase